MIDSGSLAAASDVCRTVVAYCGICMWGTTWFVDLRVRRKSWFVDLRCLTFLFSVQDILKRKTTGRYLQTIYDRY